MNEQVFLSILSMDSYNRGGGLNILGDHLGAAVLTDFSEYEPTGFVAQAYTWNGKTVISYRGTDFGEFAPDPLDVYNGWLVGGGSISGQLLNAINFYTSVTGAALDERRDDALTAIAEENRIIGGGDEIC